MDGPDSRYLKSVASNPRTGSGPASPAGRAPRRRSRRLRWTALRKGGLYLCLQLAACAFAADPPAALASAPLPGACGLVSSSLIASALGTKKPPAGTLATVTNASTCSYNNVLTISVGYTALTNPAAPATQTKIAGIPNGIYETYSGSTQTQITFFKGAAATGVYCVVRNFGRIPKQKLIKVAKALSKAVGSSAGGSTPGGSLIP